MIVCKFGGSSTTSLVSIENIKKLSENKERKVFVFSAIGKPYFNNKKLTDLLYEKNFEKAQEYISFLCKQTNVKINIKKIFNEIKNNENIEFIVSRGEYLTALIMAKYLAIKYIPAENIIFFENNILNYKKIQNKLKYYIKKYNKIVIPGFYGIDENNQIKLFSRGGGDVTGAIVAKCTKAKVYENYTDVNGIKSVNPNILENAKQIKRISYKDAFVMTNCDAKVVHQDVCEILKNTNIITKVQNIFNLKNNPTIIDKKNHNCQFVCYKNSGDYVQIVAKANNIQKLKNFYDLVNYLNKDYIYFCSDTNNFQKVIKGIYKAIF